MIEKWLAEIKEKASPESLGMILVHNGIVRSVSKLGKSVGGMRLSYDEERLTHLLSE